MYHYATCLHSQQGLVLVLGVMLSVGRRCYVHNNMRVILWPTSLAFLGFTMSLQPYSSLDSVILSQYFLSALPYGHQHQVSLALQLSRRSVYRLCAMLVILLLFLSTAIRASTLRVQALCRAIYAIMSLACWLTGLTRCHWLNSGTLDQLSDYIMCLWLVGSLDYLCVSGSTAARWTN